DLADAARTAGIDVRTEISVTPGDLVPVADSTAFRIVQEAVTNMLRHSGAAHALITAHLVDDVLHVEVSDDGRGAPDAMAPDAMSPCGTAQAGYGLAGLAERVRLLGGTLSTHSDDGFALRARIPARP
ncbi:MAG: ATP-binding protein, partial [Pseudonocardia sp.]|nr:ATP-binding protein [Pseudonocardia sp.]